MKNNKISWDNYFMGISKLSALRSKDPSTKVGACIINEEKRIVGIGYNGFPNNCSDDTFPWGKNNANELDNKYMYVVHAELNAILNSTTNLKNATLYTTLFPCNECAKAIIQSGVKEIVYINDNYSDTISTIASKKMLDSSNVIYRKIADFNIKI